MRQDFVHMSLELHQRAISDDELTTLRRHAEQVRQAPEIAHALKQHEHEIVHATANKVYQKYPERLQQYEQAKLKTLRDMRSVLGYCLYSVVLDDPDYAKNTMLYWFRTILNSFEFGHDFIEDAYRMLQAEVTAHLRPAEAAPLVGMLDDAIAVFTSPNMG